MAAPNTFTGTTAGIGALGTVILGTPATGQVLFWDGNEWTNGNVTSATGGTVSSIGIVGGTTGLTFSNSPITASGTMTLSGTLAVGSGGTGVATLTVGHIPFGAGTSPLASTNDLFFDSVNNRLGILTTTPETSLHVGNNTTGLNNLALFESGDQVARISFKDNTTTSISAVGVGAKGDNLRLLSGDTVSVIVDSNQNLSVDGSVRIGNTGTPVAPLHINATTSQVGFFTSTQSNAYFEFFDGDTTGLNYVNVGATGDNLTFKSNNVGYRWATADGSNGQVLTTDGSGNLSFTTVSGGGGGGMTSWTLRGNSGVNQTITDAEQVTFSGSGGLTTVAGAVDLLTIQTTGVLEDLNTLGAPTADGEFIVATGAGAFSYETGATVRNSLGLGTMATQNANAVAITGGTISGVSGLADPSTGSANQFNVADGSGGWDSATVYYHNAGSGGIKIGSSSLPDYAIAATSGSTNAFVGRFVSQLSQSKLAFVSSTTTGNSSAAIGTQNSRLLLVSNGTDYLFPSSDGSSGDVLTTDGSGDLSFTTIKGRFSWTLPATSTGNTITVTDTSVTATSTIVFSLEAEDADVSFQNAYISQRSTGTSFTVTYDVITGGGTKTGYVNYMNL